MGARSVGPFMVGANLTGLVHYGTLAFTPPPGGWGIFLGAWAVSEEYKQDVLNRLKSIEGHVRGIQRMVDEDAYCIDIINQILAVQRALEKINNLILERHLQTCVTTAIRGDDPAERERVIAELLRAFETAGKM